MGGKGKIEDRTSLVSQNDKDQPFELRILKWSTVHAVPMVHCDITTPLIITVLCCDITILYSTDAVCSIVKSDQPLLKTRVLMPSLWGIVTIQ